MMLMLMSNQVTYLILAVAQSGVEMELVMICFHLALMVLTFGRQEEAIKFELC